MNAQDKWWERIERKQQGHMRHFHWENFEFLNKIYCVVSFIRFSSFNWINLIHCDLVSHSKDLLLFDLNEYFVFIFFFCFFRVIFTYDSSCVNVSNRRIRRRNGRKNIQNISTRSISYSDQSYHSILIFTNFLVYWK